MTLIRRLMMAGATMLAGYAIKKLMTSVEAQAQKMKDQAEKQADARRDPKEFKRLKQDPETGVYYAED
jgi:hypothetical protein